MSEFAYSMAGFTRHETEVNGIAQIWWEIGAGAPQSSPCVYFHGGGTYHGFDWARDWADRFRMILPHHPNFGESGDADFNCMDDYAAHYRAFFAAIGLARFDLIGASMGGYLAATYAARNQAQIGKLVLVSPAGLRSDQAPFPNFAAIPPETASDPVRVRSGLDRALLACATRPAMDGPARTRIRRLDARARRAGRDLCDFVARS